MNNFYNKRFDINKWFITMVNRENLYKKVNYSIDKVIVLDYTINENSCNIFCAKCKQLQSVRTLLEKLKLKSDVILIIRLIINLNVSSFKGDLSNITQGDILG